MEAVTDRLSLIEPRELLAVAVGAGAVRVLATLLPHKATWAPRFLVTSLTSLGFWVALSSPGGATPRSTDHPSRPSDAPEAPWSPAEGPPPLPPAGVKGSVPVDKPAGAGPASPKPHRGSSAAKPPHPAIHRGGGKPSGPLFPRVREPQLGCHEEAKRAACMRRHPAGRSLETAGSGPGPDSATVSMPDVGPDLVGAATHADHEDVPTNLQPKASHRSSGKKDRPVAVTSRSRNYVVQRGDSLWAIAEDLLGTDNASRVARYWPAIHRANRGTIGRDPNFLLPGQVLHLPDPAEF